MSCVFSVNADKPWKTYSIFFYQNSQAFKYILSYSLKLVHLKDTPKFTQWFPNPRSLSPKWVLWYLFDFLLIVEKCQNGYFYGLPSITHHLSVQDGGLLAPSRHDRQLLPVPRWKIGFRPNSQHVHLCQSCPSLVNKAPTPCRLQTCSVAGNRAWLRLNVLLQDNNRRQFFQLCRAERNPSIKKHDSFTETLKNKTCHLIASENSSFYSSCFFSFQRGFAEPAMCRAWRDTGSVSLLLLLSQIQPWEDNL